MAPSPLAVTMPTDSTVGDLLHTLTQRHPALGTLWQALAGQVQIAVNNEQLRSLNQKLAKKDREKVEVDVLIIPPMVGG